MKTTLILTAALAALIVTVPASFAADTQAIALGARQHAAHSIFTDLPFDDDIGYTLAYEYHSTDAYWQFGVGYTPDPGGSNAVDYVITPQINLMAKDNFWRGGAGLAASYIETDTDSDWTDLYFQLLLGVAIPFGAMEIDIQAIYVFEDWGELGDFDFDDLDYGAWLKYTF